MCPLRFFEMDHSPSPSPSRFLLSDLSRLKTREEVIRFISSSLTSIDTDCALHNTSFKIKESTDFLLEADAIIGTMTTKFDVQLLQQTWKRLIAFYKSYHSLITSEQVDRITNVLHRRACYFVNALCAQNVAEKNIIFSQEAQQRNYSSMVSNLQSLSFYCQRISASMAYFSNNFEHDAFQMSIDILFFFRGFLSYYPSSPSIITKSEEFFRKALRSPFTATNEETNSSSDQSIDQKDEFSRVAKRSRCITDSDTVSHSLNELSSLSSPFKKFDSAVRSKNRLCCSSFNEECGEGDIGDLTAHCLSLGICSLASSELEKLSLDHSDPIPIPTPVPVPVPIPDSNSALRPVGACDAVNEKHRGSSDRQGTVLVLLDIFLFSIQKICISYNCISSDLSITDAIKHFLHAFLYYLDSTKETGSSSANAVIVSSSVTVTVDSGSDGDCLKPNHLALTSRIFPQFNPRSYNHPSFLSPS